MREPVSCANCGWPRDQALVETCFPCGSSRFYRIQPGHRIACVACGIHRNDSEPVCGCGSRAFERVRPSPADAPALLAEITDRIADLVQADPSPVNLQLAAAVSDAALAPEIPERRTA